MSPALQPAIAQLSPAEKLRLVEELWDHLATSGIDFPLTSSQQAELRAEREAIRRDPREGSSWADAKKRIIGR
jgi:putative addiction module component (TIGR02574 family)